MQLWVTHSRGITRVMTRSLNCPRRVILIISVSIDHCKRPEKRIIAITITYFDRRAYLERRSETIANFGFETINIFRGMFSRNYSIAAPPLRHCSWHLLIGFITAFLASEGVAEGWRARGR